MCKLGVCDSDWNSGGDSVDDRRPNMFRGGWPRKRRSRGGSVDGFGYANQGYD